MSQNRAMRVGFGITPVIMVLLTLLFTSFGALSYQTACADAKLTDKTVQSAKQYYEADSRCEETLAKVDQAFQRAEQKYGTRHAAKYRDAVTASLKELHPDTVTEQEDQSLLVVFSYQMNDNNRYELSLCCFPENNQSSYEVHARKVTNTAEWNSDPLEVWIGD